ncbi:hypothetical protein D210916BOD24_00600 [Alteromonas sp. D210916BOD_24]
MRLPPSFLEGVDLVDLVLAEEESLDNFFATRKRHEEHKNEYALLAMKSDKSALYVPTLPLGQICNNS